MYKVRENDGRKRRDRIKISRDRFRIQSFNRKEREIKKKVIILGKGSKVEGRERSEEKRGFEIVEWKSKNYLHRGSIKKEVFGPETSIWSSWGTRLRGPRNLNSLNSKRVSQPKCVTGVNTDEREKWNRLDVKYLITIE